ncbi:MAG: hypothetical protein ABW092_14530 [Candidatus Thiodiazotropha sp.]
MTAKKRMTCFRVVLAVLTIIAGETALAACNATINGRPMSQQECALSIQVYGQVIPGDYLMDGYGNWVNANNPMHRGNTYRDAQSQGSRGGSWGGGSYVSPRGVYDASGGCEGGGCVNIID